MSRLARGSSPCGPTIKRFLEVTGCSLKFLEVALCNVKKPFLSYGFAERMRSNGTSRNVKKHT